MILLLIICIVASVISLGLTLFLGVKGIIIGSLINGIAFAFSYTALSGFGSPTGYVPKISFGTYLICFFAFFFVSGFLLAGPYLIKAQITGVGNSPKWLAVWVILFAIGIFITFFAHNFKRQYSVRIKHPESIELNYQNTLIKGHLWGQEIDTYYINSRGSSGVGAFEYVWLRPSKLEVIINEKSSFVDVSKQKGSIHLVLDENGDVSLNLEFMKKLEEQKNKRESN